MVYLFRADDHAPARAAAPERRRAVVIGATAAGISAAWHLGEHCLLLERRHTLEDSNDHPHDFPMGATSRRALGAEESVADGERPGVTTAERRALFISCSSAGAGAHDHNLIHIERWRPPDLTASPPRSDEHSPPPSAAALIPQLRGELRLGACVVRLSPSLHLLELADGSRIVYDKLLSTLPPAALSRLVAHELPARVRCDEVLRYWLGEHDVELADAATQEYYGDADDLFAGRRIARQIEHALTEKFGHGARQGARNPRLFEPRIVSATHTMP